MLSQESMSHNEGVGLPARVSSATDVFIVVQRGYHVHLNQSRTVTAFTSV